MTDAPAVKTQLTSVPPVLVDLPPTVNVSVAVPPTQSTETDNAKLVSLDVLHVPEL